MYQIALIIIYNHRYDQNIEPLEKVYHDRFSHIYHLVPFYDGDKENVIPVYENSIYYQGYMVQGLQSYFSEQFTHYLYIGDDVFLNPTINEQNYHEAFKLQEETSFLPGFITLHHTNSEAWPRVKEAFEFVPRIKGAEIDHVLPNFDEALHKFHHQDLELKPLTYQQVFKKPKIRKNAFLLSILRYAYWLVRGLLNIKRKYNLNYPLVGSFTDIMIVSSKSLQAFIQYAACFSVMKLFHELALPTALVLASKNIVTETELEQQGKTLWDEKDLAFLNPYNKNLNVLMEEFPDNLLYIHPVKLSQWSMEAVPKSHQ